MVKMGKSSNKLNHFLSHVYVSPGHATSFTGLGKSYRTVKNHFPVVTRKKYENGQKIIFPIRYAYPPSGRTFKRNKVYAPKIGSLCEGDLPFVQDVTKENDGVNYLFVVIDVLSKYVWVRPMKNKTARSLLESFGSILTEGRKPEKLRTDKGT